MKKSIVFSVVSHCQEKLVSKLLNDLNIFLKIGSCEFKVVVTHNIEEVCTSHSVYKFPVRRRFNKNPCGFGFNHNLVFEEENPDIFMVVNPDIRLIAKLDLDTIISAMSKDVIMSPRILDNYGALTDFIRTDITPINLLLRLLRLDQASKRVDWIGGMFLIFPAELFKRLNGFDARYYMYVEDCDICWRCKLIGGSLKVLESVSVIHESQRDSHRSFKYFRWHIASIFYYWLKKIHFFACNKLL